MTTEWTKPRPLNTLLNYGIRVAAPEPHSWHTADPHFGEPREAKTTADEVKEVDSQQAVAVDEVVPDIPPNRGDEASSPVKAPSQERLVASMASYMNDLLAGYPPEEFQFPR